MGARHKGNLFLADEGGEGHAGEGLALQRALGCESEWLDATTIEERFSGMRLQGIVGGTFGRADGSVDPGAVLRGYRNKAIELGARYLEEEVVVECVAYTVCSTLGLDTAGFSVPYLARWGEGGEIERYAALIDRLARRLEDAALAAGAPEVEGELVAA